MDPTILDMRTRIVSLPEKEDGPGYMECIECRRTMIEMTPTRPEEAWLLEVHAPVNERATLYACFGCSRAVIVAWGTRGPSVTTDKDTRYGG